MEEDTLETYERVTKVANITTYLGTAVSVLLNFWVILSLMTDLLGVDFGEWARKIVEHGWKLPENWVQQYQPFLTMLQWILLFTVIADTSMTFKYSKEGEPRVPRSYLRVVSFIGFFCGMWLYLAYQVVAYGIIFFASFVTFMWTMFARKEEVEEKEEKIEPELWKESASIYGWW